ncbi:hypothetical protein F1B92_01055 [Campylobacter sp. FMV-PI01]|uniref:Uncharacterized protein n=1 Tax=Campylobacter portucalensis TaxID=2608384 RepID=A0A6L5WGA8_9BACT|nr:hypothetical protein [Campylobacter portucalensis]MSN95796.1 hypothetical protein [Campylobacter portucalensis]
MKNTKDIVREIHKTPLYDEIKDLQDFFNCLSPTHKEVTAFIYLKKEDKNQEVPNLLMFACKHNAGLQELKRDSSIKNIKYLLNLFIKVRPVSKLNKIKDVKFFVATNYMKRQQKALKNIQNTISQIPPYFEKSNGKFKNNFKDENLYNKFEEIRKIILASK